MAEADLFEQLDNEVLDTPEVETPTDGLIGEGKRYGDVPTAERALIEKDRFIETLKRENAEMRGTLSERINMEQFLEKLEGSRTTTSPSGLNTMSAERDDQGAAVTPEAVKQLLAQHEAEKLRRANRQVVETKLQEAYGANWKQEVRKKAEALGVSTGFLTEVTERSPKAVFSLLGVDQSQKEGFSPPPRSQSFTPTGNSAVKDYSYWQRMRQEKGEDWYFSIPVSRERMNALNELGDAFNKK